MVGFSAVKARMHFKKLSIAFGVAIMVISGQLAAASSYSCSPLAATTPFRSTGLLDVSLHSGLATLDENKQQVYAPMYASEGVLSQPLPNLPGQTASLLWPLAEISVMGKWWNLIGEFAANPGIAWRYRDHFAVLGDDKKRYEISRQALSAYPDLLKRFQAAKPEFDRIEIRADAVYDDAGGSPSATVALRVHANDVLVPNEGSSPYMVPMSPAKWEDRLALGNVIESELPQAWSRLRGVRCPIVTFYGLRLPRAELVSIAKELKAYQDEDARAEKLLGMTKADYRPPQATKPYQGSAEMSQPFIPEVKTAEIVREGTKVGLRPRGLSAASAQGPVIYPAGDFVGARPLDAHGKFFVFTTTAKQASIVAANGRVISVAGLSSFHSIDEEEKEQRISFYPENHRSSSAIYRTKAWYSSRGAFDAMSERGFEDFKSRDVMPPCPKYKGNGVMIARSLSRFDMHRTRRVVTDYALKIVEDGPVILPGEGYGTQRGDKTCL